MGSGWCGVKAMANHKKVAGFGRLQGQCVFPFAKGNALDMLPAMKCFVLCLACWSWCASGALGDTLAFFNTPLGQMQVGLYDKDKPVTTRNFIRYAQSGNYSNMFLHRCLPNFVVQGGGFAVKDPTSYDLFTGYLGVKDFGKITNEFGAGPLLSNTYGTLAMAKVGSDPNSASSQWFFNLTNNSANLDKQNGGFTVFGRVLSGMPVLEAFNALTYGGGVVDMTFFYGPIAALFSDLPVNYQGVTPPSVRDLMFTGVSLMTVQMALSNGECQISWNSASNKLNMVEFATNNPPTWQSLTSVTGTGGAMSVKDSVQKTGLRMYRVRVNY